MIINTYNGEDVIEETIYSILNQSYHDFEIIVVDDCSQDHTVGKVRKISDPRIRVFINEKNRGAAYSIQKGMVKARGDYIAKTDQDDISYRKRLEKQLIYMENHPDVFLCGCYHDLFYSYEDRRPCERVKHLRTNEYRYTLLFMYSGFIHSSFFFRRMEAERKGIRYTSFTFSEDYSFLIQAATKARIGLVRDVLVGYRMHDGQLTNRMSPFEENMKLIETFSKNMGLSRKWREIAIKGIGGRLETINEFEKYIKLFYIFAKKCNISVSDPRDKAIMIYVFRNAMKRQRQRNIIELLAYVLSGLCDWRFIFSDRGKTYVRHCLANGLRRTDIF